MQKKRHEREATRELHPFIREIEMENQGICSQVLSYYKNNKFSFIFVE